MKQFYFLILILLSGNAYAWSPDNHGIFDPATAAYNACVAHQNTETNVYSGCGPTGGPASTYGSPYDTMNYYTVCTSDDSICHRFHIAGCAGGEYWNGTSCVTGTAPAGTAVPLTFSGTPPASICHNGEWHNLGGDGIVMTDDAGNNLANYISTGNTCVVETSGLSPAPVDQCVTGSNGVELCLTQNDTNCGYYNDVYGCAESIPQTGECYLLGGGGYICNGSTPPDNTAGQPETKLGEISGDENEDGTVETGDVYSQDGVGFAVQQDLKIDETGTPIGTDNMYDGALDSATDAFITGIGTEQGTVANTGNAFSLDMGVDFGWLDNATCSSSTYYVAGHAFDFPGTRGCTFLAGFKIIFGYFLYGMTAIYIFRMAMNRESKV